MIDKSTDGPMNRASASSWHQLAIFIGSSFDLGLIYQLLIEPVATTQSAHNSAYQPTMLPASLPAATSDKGDEEDISGVGQGASLVDRPTQLNWYHFSLVWYFSVSVVLQLKAYEYKRHFWGRPRGFLNSNEKSSWYGQDNLQRGLDAWKKWNRIIL